MRTLVKGQTKTTTPQKKTHPTHPMVLPQTTKPTQNTTDRLWSEPQELLPGAHEPTISFQQTPVYWTSHDGATPSQSCAQTTTTPSSDYTLNNQLHMTPFPPLFQQDTYVSRRNATSSGILASTSMARGHAGQSGVGPGSWETLCTYMPLSVLNRYRNWAWRLRASLRARFRLL